MPTLRSAGAMLSKRHGLNFEIHNSVQLPTNLMIQGQPNVCSSCIRSSGSLRWQTVSSRNLANSQLSKLGAEECPATPARWVRSIDVQVLRLRRKLEIDPNAPRVIETER